MLGNHGSNPLELFWDLVDNLDQQLDAKIAVAEGAIKRHNKKLEAQQEKQVPEGKEMNLFKISPETSEEEFLAVIQGNEDEDVRKLSMQDLQEIYQTVSQRSSSTDGIKSRCAATVTLASHEAAGGREAPCGAATAPFAGRSALCSQKAVRAYRSEHVVRRGRSRIDIKMSRTNMLALG